ncbi:M48 family metallopeptidase [Kordia algicida OT-1]|uniref:tRNA pseudouridine synthase C n=1 Tax=Kordia algicida OT-1 TaxID=391587 RepID=A9E0L3_9FLAO|nr:M48 family metallopeptidase [Kordia algicida]EDP95888.1 tRNA pseudouridine synthase C [Kordia algicida OT-1]
MSSLYTRGPANIPAGLTKPTKSFKKHVWLSVIGLLLFIILYLLLTFWFGKLAYDTFTGAGRNDISFWRLAAGVGFGFLSLFMLKSLFFLNKKEENPLDKYVTEAEEPVLFDYLYKLADEAGAPRPHKVFLTDRVNASVSYDISLINLLFPSKKNLEIGLAIVNVLNLGELKAVIAHEFGHFAQRSMLLGRYVYVAHQIAARIIAKRDIFDQFLNGLSGFDLRIAWIGWILSILVWAIRSLVETCFSIVLIAHRALSREMEFQADLVAVSLTGSDALIHALYKLRIADDAYANAIQVANVELSKKRAVTDLYTLQTNYIEKMRHILDDPTYGHSPEIPSFDKASNRIFKSGKFNPPQMWATHPADNDRENNAKKTYISAAIDDRSSWDLFSNPKQLREEMTERLLKLASVEIKEKCTEAESIATQNELDFDWSFLAPKYHSTFYRRYPFTNFKSVDELYTATFSTDMEKMFDALYPKEIASKLEQLQEIIEEKNILIVAQNEVITAEKRILYHRGEQIKRNDIPEILTQLRTEEQLLREEVKEHDKLCRNVHYKAAQKLGTGWDVQLKNLHKILHYTEHTVTNLEDCGGKYHNIVAMALADGRVSSKELSDIINVSTEYYHVIRKAFNQAETIRLDSNILSKLKVVSFFDLLEKFEFPPPMDANINEWTQHVDSWANVVSNAMQKLRNVALEELLTIEDNVKNAYLNKQNLVPALNEKVTLVEEYEVLTPGMERPRRLKLDFWSRFFIGDGIFHSISKFAVSGAILFAALYFGGGSYTSEMYIYNGLGIPVTVTYAEDEVDIAANSYQQIDVDYNKDYLFKVFSEDQKSIENFKSNFWDSSYTYIYNIASAGLLIESPVYYGESTPTPKRIFAKTDKWVGTSADYIFEDAPSMLSTKSSQRYITKYVLLGYSDLSPYDIISNISDEKQQSDIISSHAIWDSKDSKHTLNWLAFSYLADNQPEVLNKRLKNNPMDVMTLRALYDSADSIQKPKLVEDFREISNKNPRDPNYYYLATRTIEDETLKNQTFIDGHNKWKMHPWLAFAAGYSYLEKDEWEKGYNALIIASKKNKSIAEYIAIDVERVRRFLSETSKTKVSSTPITMSESLKYYRNLENGTLENGMSDPYYAYYLLSQGETLKAYNFSKRDKQAQPFILRMLAVSKYATNQMIKEALALPETEGISHITAWSAIGLAINKQLPYDVYIQSLAGIVDAETVQQFIFQVKANNFKQAEKVIENTDFNVKPHFYTLGNIISGKNAPKLWRQKMETLLYVDERPYL